MEGVTKDGDVRFMLHVHPPGTPVSPRVCWFVQWKNYFNRRA